MVANTFSTTPHLTGGRGNLLLGWFHTVSLESIKTQRISLLARHLSVTVDIPEGLKGEATVRSPRGQTDMATRDRRALEKPTTSDPQAKHSELVVAKTLRDDAPSVHLGAALTIQNICDV